MPRTPLDYTSPTRRGSRKVWAGAFLIAGFYALACIPAVFVFERLGWKDDPIHFTAFFACILCVISAIKFLAFDRNLSDETKRSPIRTLAIAAIILAGGFLLLVVVVSVWFWHQMCDF